MGTAAVMLDFDLDKFFPMVASDEGPPFGRELGVTTEGICDKLTAMIRVMVRWN